MNEKQLLFNLYWGNDDEDEDGYTLSAEKVTSEQAWKLISDWRKTNAPSLHLDGHGYYRCHNTTDGIQHIDYGSHCNFFQLRPII